MRPKGTGGSKMNLGAWLLGGTATAQLGPTPHLPTGLLQQLPIWTHRLLLVEGDQGVQRIMGAVLPRD